MATTRVCDRCGHKPRARFSDSGWVIVRVYGQREGDRPVREFDLCESCLAIFNAAVAKPGRRPKNVTDFNAIRAVAGPAT